MTGQIIAPQAFQQGQRNDDDLLLAMRVKNGDQLALRALYDKHVNRVYGLCVRLTGDVSLAEDVCQEVFVQVWQKIESFRGDSKFSTWLHSVTSNIAISHMRKQKPWWKVWFGSDEQNQLALEQIAIDDAQQDFALSRSGLDKHIAQLPEQARIVFVLYAIEGWRHEEIAKQLNIAVGTSKAQFHRARQLLQTAIEQE